MVLEVIYDSRKNMSLRLTMQGLPLKHYTVELFDNKHRLFHRDFAISDYDEARRTFDELQRSYDLH